MLKILLSERIPLELVCSRPLRESLSRLADSTSGSASPLTLNDEIVGSVSSSKINLTRNRPFVRNGFRAHFSGVLRQEGSKVVLRGEFRLGQGGDVFTLIWFGFIFLWTVVAYFTTDYASDEWWLPYAGLGMLSFGLGLTWIGKRSGYKDVEWLTSHLREALQ